MDWIRGILEGVFGSLLWDMVLASLVATLLAYLRTKYKDWAPPAIYAVCGFTAVFVIAYAFVGHALLYKEQPHTTTKNVEENVKAWSDTFGLSVQKQSDSNFEFVLGIILPNGRKIQVGRPKQRGQYLEYQATLLPGPEQRVILEKLSGPQKQEILHEINLELARSRIGYTVLGTTDSPLKVTILIKMVPITDNLTEDSFISSINEMDSGIAFADEVITLSVERNSAVKLHPALSQ